MSRKTAIRYDHVCNSHPDGIIILDLEGKVVLLNKACEAMFGFSKREVEQKFCCEVFKKIPEIISVIEKREHQKELYYNRENDQLRVELNVCPIQNSKGHVLGTILIFKDISKSKKIDEQVQRIGRLASIGQLVAGIAHEVRNPLSGIGYILDELHDYHKHERDKREVIEKALREIDRLEQIISGLLDFARVDRFNLSKQNVHNILDETLMWVNKRCSKLGIKILKEYGQHVSETMLDPDKIKQALLNLLINAIEASEEGGIIKIKTRGYSGRGNQLLDEGKFIEVIIEDSGNGIAIQDQGKIFDPFFTTKPSGTGLGLSIAHSIIGEHGGKISVDSEAGKGSKFITYIPTLSRRKGGILRVGIESRIDALDPHNYGGWMTYRILRNIFEGLVDRDLTSSQPAYAPIIPGLAESWSLSADGLTYTFKLRDGVQFHDGTHFNAEVVKFNIDRMTNQSAPQYDAKSARYSMFIWRYLKGVEVIDPLQVRINLCEPFSDFLAQLTEGGIGSAKMISPAAWRRYGNSSIKDHPVGTGPFRFLEKGKNGEIVLERNHNYWGKKPLLDKLVFKPIPNSASRVASLQAGDVDLIFVPPPDTIDILKKSGFKITQGLTPHVWFLCLNMQNRKMQDLRVRQAINLAIDKEGMARNLLHGTAKPARGLQVPGSPSYDPSFIDYEYDPEMARKLLADAGYAKGLKVTFQTSTSGSGQLIPVAMADWIRRDLERVNIDCRLDLHEWVRYIGLWARGMHRNITVNQISWGISSDYWLEVIAHSKNWGPEGRNTGYYSNPVVDNLLDRARVEHNLKKKSALIRKADALITKDAAFVPIVNDLAPLCMSEKVKGFVHAPSEWYDFTTVWVED